METREERRNWFSSRGTGIKAEKGGGRKGLKGRKRKSTSII